MIGEIIINPPIATYQEPTVLGDLRRINFIFGANATGKTTISRVIAQAEGHSHCQLSWRGGSPLDVMIYNRDFVESNFSHEGPLQGVFTLGEDQVEAEREIARLQPDVDRVRGQIASLNNQLEGEDGQLGKRRELADLDPKLREVCWKQKELHDGYFEAAFSGVRNSKENFKNRVLVEWSSNNAELLALDELKEKASTVFSESLDNVPVLDSLNGRNLIATESSEYLKKIIVGDQDVDIAGLIDRLGNSDWVKQGLKYHEQNPEACPFCQQSTDEHFSESLQLFFSEAYDNDIQVLKRLQDEYQSACDQLLSAVQANGECNNPYLKRDLFNAEAQALAERLKRNQVLLENKLAEPSRKVELEPIEPFLTQLQGMISDANAATATHNQTVSNIASEKQSLTSQVWRFVLNELADDLSQYEQKKGALNRAIQGMEESLLNRNQILRDLNIKIRELERQTTSIQPTITGINELLEKFGFHSFRIGEAVEGRHYRIVRDNGEDASRSLSEGERTFITFLYFYYLIKGAQTPSGISTNRIVVFDDPISSLDSDILYIVSSLIKAIMEEVRDQDSQIKQVFILTHNVYFHKEISFHKNRSASNAMADESFWIVKKTQQGSRIVRCDNNPIRSAYELLWEDVRPQNISSVSLQNTLRRILENYFTMWGGKSKDEICELFEGREKLICQSLFSWVNDGSHSIHDDLYVNHGEQTNAAYLRVFREIFVRSDQLGHFNMMIGQGYDFGALLNGVEGSVEAQPAIAEPA